MSIVFVGDWLPSRPVDARAVLGSDCAVGNLECVISSLSNRTEKAHSLVLDDSAYELVKNSGFAALSLANNHVNDAGLAAFDAMVDELNTFDAIQFFGTMKQPFAELVHGGLRCAVVGCLEKCRARGNNLFPEESVGGLIRQIRADYDRIVVTPHWGKESEYADQPSPQQIRRAESWIEAGADGVVGHHSHTIHGIRHRSDKPIYFSLGNFEFLHPASMAHPAARYGLQVDWCPESHEWQHRFLTCRDGAARAASSEESELLEGHLANLSASVRDVGGLSGYLRWARRVGPIYIPKSMASWRTRLRKSFASSFPRFCVWSLLPTTWIMALGNWLRDGQYLDQRQQIFARLGEVNTHTFSPVPQGQEN